MSTMSTYLTAFGSSSGEEALFWDNDGLDLLTSCH